MELTGFQVPPIIHCVRHAQGYHNISPVNFQMLDPPLTAEGETQCAALAATFPHHSTVELLVSSPLRRTLQTTLLTFCSSSSLPLEEKKQQKSIIALPQAQEVAAIPCDTGSDLDILKKDFSSTTITVKHNAVIDLSLVPADWNLKAGVYSPRPAAVRARAGFVRRWLKARPEKEIVLVSHLGFLNYLIEDEKDGKSGGGPVQGGWMNCEWRSYKFADDREGEGEGEEYAGMVELPESVARRLGGGVMKREASI